MNIFILDTNPKIASQYHNDKHCVKMILETSQLLCTAHWLNNSNAPYKPTHKNHPCSVWTRSSVGNYMWLCNLGKELCIEYTYRYGRIHKSEQVIDYCTNNIPNIKSIGITPFALAMPNEFKISKDAVKCYQNYYRYAKTHLIKYTKREIPKFLIDIPNFTLTN